VEEVEDSEQTKSVEMRSLATPHIGTETAPAIREAPSLEEPEPEPEVEKEPEPEAEAKESESKPEPEVEKESEPDSLM
jgi:hypothetical protein